MLLLEGNFGNGEDDEVKDVTLYLNNGKKLVDQSYEKYRNNRNGDYYLIALDNYDEIGEDIYITKVTGTLPLVSANFTNDRNATVNGDRGFSAIGNVSEKITDTTQTFKLIDNDEYTQKIKIKQSKDIVKENRVGITVEKIESEYNIGDKVNLQVKISNSVTGPSKFYGVDKYIDSFTHLPIIYLQIPSGHSLESYSISEYTSGASEEKDVKDLFSYRELSGSEYDREGVKIIELKLKDSNSLVLGYKPEELLKNSVRHFPKELKVDIEYKINDENFSKKNKFFPRESILIGNEINDFFGGDGISLYLTNSDDKVDKFNGGKTLVTYPKSTVYYVNPKNEFSLYSGIKRKGEVGEYYYYAGSDIAPLYKDEEIEMELSYLNNTQAEVEWEESRLYLPIPRNKEKDYGAVFNNKSLDRPTDPLENDKTKFKWTGYLKKEVELSDNIKKKFNVLYSTNSIVSEEEPFRPAEGDWKNWEKISDKKEIDGIKIELEEGETIVDGENGSFILTLELDEGSELNDVNYWRPYRISGYNNNGIWAADYSVGGIIAGKIATNISGNIFYDYNGNGKIDKDEELITDSANEGIVVSFMKYEEEDEKINSVNIKDGKFVIEDLFGENEKGEELEYKIKISKSKDDKYRFTDSDKNEYSLENISLNLEGKIISEGKELEEINIGLVEEKTAKFKLPDGFENLQIKLGNENILYKEYSVYAGYTLPIGGEPIVKGLRNYIHTGWKIISDMEEIDIIVEKDELLSEKLPGGNLTIEPVLKIKDIIEQIDPSIPVDPGSPIVPESPDSSKKKDKPNEIVDPKTPELNREEHYKYISGYEDGTIRPEDNITREEATTIIYRILDKDYRNSILTNTSSFKDVEKDRWSVEYIGTVEKGNIIKGYPDKTFRPDDNITRGETATIISRFTGTNSDNELELTDIKGHWAEDYIVNAIKKDWIKGYEDNTFKPDQAITRAEFITIINRVLERGINLELLDNIKTFIDIDPEKWYYKEILEATIDHDYIIEDGIEKWIEIN